MLAAYARASARRPLLTNISVGVGVMLTGDFLSQKLLEHKEEIDKFRLARTSFWNGFVVSPFFWIWFRYLDRMLPGQHLKKTLVNQAVMSVPTSSAFLLYSTLVGEWWRCHCDGEDFDLNATLARGGEKIVRDVPTLVSTSALFWVPVNYLNFAYVPAKYRVLPSICGGVIWGSFLTFIGHRNHASAAISSNNTEEKA